MLTPSQILVTDEWSLIEKGERQQTNILEYIPKFKADCKLYDMVKISGILPKQKSTKTPFIEIDKHIFVVLDEPHTLFPSLQLDQPIVTERRISFTAIVSSKTGRITVTPIILP